MSALAASIYDQLRAQSIGQEQARQVAEAVAEQQGDDPANAAQLLRDAQDKAEQILRDAQDKAAQILRDALRDAQDKAAQLLGDAKAEIAQLLADARAAKAEGAQVADHPAVDQAAVDHAVDQAVARSEEKTAAAFVTKDEFHARTGALATREDLHREIAQVRAEINQVRAEIAELRRENNTRMDDGFARVNARIDNANRISIAILVAILSLVVTALLTGAPAPA